MPYFQNPFGMYPQGYMTPGMSYGMQQQQQQTGPIKVNGRDSALQYPVPPNTQSQPLFDYNGKVFYVVTADGAGTKTVETFDFKPHVDEQPMEVDGATFVSRAEFDVFVAKVNAAIGAIDGLHGPLQAPAEPDGQPSARHSAADGR